MGSERCNEMTTAALARELGWTCKEPGWWETDLKDQIMFGSAKVAEKRGWWLYPIKGYASVHPTLKAAMLAGEKER